MTAEKGEFPSEDEIRSEMEQEDYPTVFDRFGRDDIDNLLPNVLIQFPELVINPQINVRYQRKLAEQIGEIFDDPTATIPEDWSIFRSDIVNNESDQAHFQEQKLFDREHHLLASQLVFVDPDSETRQVFEKTDYVRFDDFSIKLIRRLSQEPKIGDTLGVEVIFGQHQEEKYEQEKYFEERRGNIYSLSWSLSSLWKHRESNVYSLGQTIDEEGYQYRTYKNTAFEDTRELGVYDQQVGEFVRQSFFLAQADTKGNGYAVVAKYQNLNKLYRKSDTEIEALLQQFKPGILIDGLDSQLVIWIEEGQVAKVEFMQDDKIRQVMPLEKTAKIIGKIERLNVIPLEINESWIGELDGLYYGISVDKTGLLKYSFGPVEKVMYRRQQ